VLCYKLLLALIISVFFFQFKPTFLQHKNMSHLCGKWILSGPWPKKKKNSKHMPGTMPKQTWKKITEASAVVCLLLATALSLPT